MAERLVLATRNAHKVRELGRVLGDRVRLEPLPDEIDLPPETGKTFSENALIKARAAARATGSRAVADDSGIESAALDGGPGVYSARFAGPDATDAENLAKLRELAPAGSGLRYVCVIAHVDPATGDEHLFEGSCEGTMSAQARGERGFGYDPVFLPVEHPDRTMAELADDEKDAISHRGNAARRLRAWLDPR